MNVLPENDSERGDILLATCLLDYFPNSLAAVARHSAKSNEKHNGDCLPRWDRSKSTDHRNKIMRHLVDAGGFDADGNRHSVAIAWRGLALLEDELIAEGATPGRNAKGSPVNHASKLYDETSAIHAAQDAKSSLAEITDLREHLASEQLREYGIGDVEPATLVDMPATFTDSYGNGITRRIATHGRYSAANVSHAGQHPMAAEAIRDHDERLFGGEDRL